MLDININRLWPSVVWLIIHKRLFNLSTIIQFPLTNICTLSRLCVLFFFFSPSSWHEWIQEITWSASRSLFLSLSQVTVAGTHALMTLTTTVFQMRWIPVRWTRISGPQTSGSFRLCCWTRKAPRSPTLCGWSAAKAPSCCRRPTLILASL